MIALRRRPHRLAALGLASLLGAASTVPAHAQRVAEVQVAPPFLRLRPGAQATVLATAYDRDGMPVDARLYWTSTNINVATVDSSGAVHALAPGLAVITVSTDTTGRGGGRRHFGRTTVLVMGSEATWMRVGPEDKHLVQPGDTVAPAQCADADFGMRNPGRECWDVPPRHFGPNFLEPDSACTPPVTPPVFLARVEADGRVSSTRSLNVSTCASYQAAAEAMVRGLEFWPARRSGRSVAAWTVVAVRSVMMRMFVPPQPPMPGQEMPGQPSPAPTPPPAGKPARP